MIEFWEYSFLVGIVILSVVSGVIIKLLADEERECES